MVELRAQEQQLLTALESIGGKASVDQLIDACGVPRHRSYANGVDSSRKNLIAIHAQHPKCYQTNS